MREREGGRDGGKEGGREGEMRATPTPLNSLVKGTIGRSHPESTGLSKEGRLNTAQLSLCWYTSTLILTPLYTLHNTINHSAVNHWPGQ